MRFYLLRHRSPEIDPLTAIIMALNNTGESEAEAEEETPENCHFDDNDEANKKCEPTYPSISTTHRPTLPHRSTYTPLQ